MSRRCLKIVCIGAMIALSAGVPEAVSAVDIFQNGALQRHVEQGRLDREVRDTLKTKAESEVIVRLTDEFLGSQSGHEKMQDRLSTRARALAEKKKGLLNRLPRKSFSELSSYTHFPVLHLKVDEQALASLLDQSEVVSVGYNRGFKPFLAESLPLIHAPQVHSRGITGSGTAVAVLDTGVDYTLGAFGNCSSPGVPFTCKVAYAQDIPASDNSLDDNGHGTNVAGIVVGVAPDTKIIALDVFRTDGYAYYSDLLTALDWVVDNRALYNIVAVNMSLGGGSSAVPCPSDYLADAILTLRAVGVLSAIASGNEAYNGALAIPACVPSAISVGAVYDSHVGPVGTSVCSDVTTTADKVACFTNMSNFLSIAAPGVFITAAGKTYTGTSQATPHVAGAIALLKGNHPSFTADAVAARLISTGIPLTTTRIPYTYLTPRLNLEDALAYPQLSSAPTSLEFGTVTAGQTSAPLPLTVTNSGDAALVLATISISGPNASEFILSTDSCSETTVPPGSSCTISVSFRPLNAAAKSAALLIPSNDPDSPDKSVPLSGYCNSFLLNVTRTGNGSVRSQPAGIDCGSTCTAGITRDTLVSLFAIPASDSLFSGWSGNCSGTGSCSVTMSTSRDVTALFSMKPPVMLQSAIPVVYYPSISAVYSAVLDGAVIELKTAAFAEDLSFDRNIAITLLGGYNESYTEVSGTSYVRSVIISSGILSISGITIQ